jgi:restriction endonuclease S subunit
LNLEEVGSLKIPVIDMKIQQKIAEMVKESFALCRESERLLAEAKEMVEREMKNE